MSAKQAQFDALVKATSGDLYRFAYWLCHHEALAEDLVQETYLRAWKSLDNLRDTSAAKAWLLTIVRREHARLYERKRLDSQPIDDIEVTDWDSQRPDEVGEDELVRRAMAKLDPKYREPLVMQILGGFSCEEIAEQTGQSAGAVMTQLFRARSKLKTLLGGEEEAKVYELS